MNIQPHHRWTSLGLNEVWEVRELLYLLSWREITARYRQMALGPLWIIVAPAIQMVVFSVLFGSIFGLPSDGVPYPVFTYCALLPWMLFSSASRNAAGSLVAQRQLIAKVYFPRLFIPLSQVITATVDFAVSLVILVGMMVAYNIIPTWRILAIPLYVLLALSTALALGLWLAPLAVKFRDVPLVFGFALNAWQYATPVAYSSSLIPEEWRWLYRLNPMTIVVDGFRWALLGVGQPSVRMELYVAGIVIVSALMGLLYFRRTEGTIVDLL